MVFGAPSTNHYGTGISMASVQTSQHFEGKNGRQKILNTLRLKDARKTLIFCTFSMIWATICTHQNHCYSYVLFSSQPQSTMFEQNLTRSLHFIGFTSEVGGESLPTLVWAVAATHDHWRKTTQI